VRYLTPLASEHRIHLTENGAVTLCGRAITKAWRRRRRPDDHPCDACEERASAIRPVLVGPRHDIAEEDAADRSVPA
jgi:tRNA G26 N,N-dimethylase Trm1